MSDRNTAGPAKVVTFYRFVSLPDCVTLAATLRRRCKAAGLLGTVILAEEGINATLAGKPEAIDAWLDELAVDPRFAGLPLRTSCAEQMPFFRMKVSLRDEIVTLGKPDVRPGERTGIHVPPEQWDALIQDPDVVVIDTRNDFEVEAGTFVGAINPGTRSFREFPDFVTERLATERRRKVAMFCTGGIRCEKASAWMLEQGFEQVYQLTGGILAYLEQIPAEAGQWQGSCFVFDQRVSLGYGLQQGGLRICHGCRHPLKEPDLAHADYEEGVSCSHCAGSLSEARRASLRERHRQVLLARARGDTHIGRPHAAPTRKVR